LDATHRRYRRRLQGRTDVDEPFGYRRRNHHPLQSRRRVLAGRKVVKLLSGLIIGFIIGVLATIGFLQMRTGQLPGLNPHPTASESPPAPATGGAPAGTNAPAAGADTGTPQKTQ